MTETWKRFSASSKHWYWKPSGGSVKSEPTPEPLGMKKFGGTSPCTFGTTDYSSRPSQTERFRHNAKQVFAIILSMGKTSIIRLLSSIPGTWRCRMAVLIENIELLCRWAAPPGQSTLVILLSGRRHRGCQHAGSQET